jgi:hypothetical protein
MIYLGLTKVQYVFRRVETVDLFILSAMMEIFWMEMDALQIAKLNEDMSAKMVLFGVLHYVA